MNTLFTILMIVGLAYSFSTSPAERDSDIKKRKQKKFL